MLVPAALLFALAASARPARLVERQDDRSPMDVGFQFKNDGRCILPKGTIGEGEPIVAEDCTGSTFSGWNLDGAAVGNAHQLRVANTNLCVAAGTDCELGKALSFDAHNPLSFFLPAASPRPFGPRR